MNIYERIKALCKEKNISITTLEKAIGVSNGSICKWKTSAPNSTTLEKITNYFDVPADYILNGWDETPGVLESNADILARATKDKDALKLLTDYYKLPQSQKKMARDFLEFMANKKDR